MLESNALQPTRAGYHRDHRALLAAGGIVLLLIGVGAALLGPLELYVFYWFSEGGRFSYPGFGFGSFMFGNMATQIIGYYVIAAILIPLGYGHVRGRRWIQPYALTVLWSWLVLGIPLAFVFMGILLSAKDLSRATAIVACAVVSLSCAVVPSLLIRFYNGENVRQTLLDRDPNPHWLNTMPIPLLVLSFLLAIYSVVLHIPILFHGLVPFFGSWLSGLPGVAALDVAALSLLAIIWGLLHRQNWAWWGSLVFVVLVLLSSLLTLLPSTWDELLDVLAFPAYERELLSNVPLQGPHIAAFFALPLLLTLGAIVAAGPHVRGKPQGKTLEPNPDIA